MFYSRNFNSPDSLLVIALFVVPEMYFEAGLNWEAWSHDLTRQVSSGLSSASKFLTILPSWSWIGWEGSIVGG
jgi:hypothetical protein